MFAPILIPQDVRDLLQTPLGIEAVCAQLDKDLRYIGALALFEEEDNLSYEVVLEELERYASYLIQNNYEVLCNLLYRVDISPETIEKYRSTYTDIGDEVLFARLLLVREAQKVMLRQRYSSGEL